MGSRRRGEVVTVVDHLNAHGQLSGCTNFSCAAAINAGIDILMAPDSWKPLFGNHNLAGVFGRFTLGDLIQIVPAI